MKHAKIIENTVVGIYLRPAPGLVEVADNVYCGMIQNQNNTFSSPVPTQEQLIDRVRFERNQLLQQSDWRMLPDYPGANQTEWQTYRQALRDITTQTPSLDSTGQLTGITWPTPPND